jgi:hypothetical protein
MAILDLNYRDNVTKVYNLIDQAYLLCGIQPSNIDAYKIEMGIDLLNQLQRSYANLGVLQFNEEIQILKLSNNLVNYQCKTGTFDVYDTKMVSLSRKYKGIATSSAGGNAANCFDSNFKTSCQQTGIGNITLDLGAGNESRIDFLGIATAPNAVPFLQFTLLGSTDNESYFILINLERLQPLQRVSINQQIYFYEIPTPQNTRYLRLLNTSPSPFNIEEIYYLSLNESTNSIYLEQKGRSEYFRATATTNPNSISSFYTLRKSDSSTYIQLYGAPSNQTIENDNSDNPQTPNYLMFRSMTYPYDVSRLNNNLAINPKFLDAFKHDLASKLALMFAPEKFQTLNAVATFELNKALACDNDRGGYGFSLKT